MRDTHAFAHITVSLLLLLLAFSSQAEDRLHILKVGMTAPNWMMKDIEGNTHSLYGELDKGNQVVMVFWASWCKYCHDLLPELSLFKISLQPDESVKFFAMNIWEDSDPVGYFDSRKIDIPLILKADAIAKRYAVDGTPGVVFVGPDKMIRYVRKTDESTASVMRTLQKLVLQPASASEATIAR